MRIGARNIEPNMTRLRIRAKNGPDKGIVIGVRIAVHCLLAITTARWILFRNALILLRLYKHAAGW